MYGGRLEIASVLYVILGQKNLTDLPAVLSKALAVFIHEDALAHGGHRLFLRNAQVLPFLSKRSRTGAYGARGNHHNLISLFHQHRQVAHETLDTSARNLTILGDEG
jgi:hypothetical protein